MENGPSVTPPPNVNGDRSSPAPLYAYPIRAASTVAPPDGRQVPSEASTPASTPPLDSRVSASARSVNRPRSSSGDATAARHVHGSGAVTAASVRREPRCCSAAASSQPPGRVYAAPTSPATALPEKFATCCCANFTAPPTRNRCAVPSARPYPAVSAKSSAETVAPVGSPDCAPSVDTSSGSLP